jgi:hypothetical protein
MTTYQIELPEALYQRLLTQAARLGLSPEQVIERLLLEEAATAAFPDDQDDTPIPPAGSPDALEAVRRLTTLFAGLRIPQVDQVLADPALALENADLDDVTL